MAKAHRAFDRVISLDSHLDVSMGGDDFLYPEELRLIAARTGAHTKIQEIVRGGLIIAIPRMMLLAHTTDIESKLPPGLRIKDQGESVASVVEFLHRKRRIEVFQSPPRSLREFIPKMKDKSWLLDIDVDYMEEMQNECYTRIVDPQPGVLQRAKHVIEFVDRTKPELVTISEAKVSALRRDDSSVSRLLKRFREMGYQIEEGSLLDDDSVERGISVCNDFYGLVSSNLMRKHAMEMVQGDLEGFRKEEEAAAKNFFAERGYG